MGPSAVAYLEGLQKEAFKRVGMHRRPTQERAEAGLELALDAAHGWAKEAEGVATRFQQALTSRMTQYEDPASHTIMAGLQERIARALSTDESAKIANTVLGSLPIGRMNAAALYHAGSQQFIVVFQTGIFRFLNLFCKAIVQLMPIRIVDGYRSIDFSGGKIALSQNPHALWRMTDLLEAYLIDGDATHALPYLQPTDREDLVQDLLAKAETFIMTHEYGHIFLEHLNRESLQAFAMPGYEAQESRLQHAHEYSADRFGLDLTLRTFAPTPDPIAVSTTYLAINMFFLAVELVDRCAAILQKQDGAALPRTDTHPLSADRREALRSTVLQKYPEIGAGVASYGAMLEQLLSELRQPIEAHFRDLFAAGQRLGPAWQSDIPPQIDDEIRSQIPWRCVKAILAGIKAECDPEFVFFAQYGKAFADYIAITLLENAAIRRDDIGRFCREELDWLEAGQGNLAGAIFNAMQLPEMERAQNETFVRAVMSVSASIERKCVARAGKGSGPPTVGTHSESDHTSEDEKSDDEKRFDELYALGTMILNLRSPSAELRHLTAQHLEHVPPHIIVGDFVLGLVHSHESVSGLAADMLLAIEPSFKYERQAIVKELQAAQSTYAVSRRFHEKASAALLELIHRSL